MLNKAETPTFEDLLRYSGAPGQLWLALDDYLKTELGATALIRFPYGKDYGWSVKYSKKTKHICDAFAENGAFAGFFQISNAAVDSVYEHLTPYTKDVWAERCPCGSGGWIDLRVLADEHLQDLKRLLHARMTVRAK